MFPCRLQFYCMSIGLLWLVGYLGIFKNFVLQIICLHIFKICSSMLHLPFKDRNKTSTCNLDIDKTHKFFS